MKILCLSDLHLREDETMDFVISGVPSLEMQKVSCIFQKENADAVVLTGDTVSSFLIPYISDVLRGVFGNSVPIIVTLGNHELWEGTYDDAISQLKNQKHSFENIHFLDLVDEFELNGCVFTGGLLFFDGSMSWSENQELKPWNGWQDWRIKNIHQDYRTICNSYIKKIEDVSKRNFGKSIFVCTHHLSDERLNGHVPSAYSMYSGIKSIIPILELSKDKDHFLICGHTHRRVIRQLSENIFGVNVGSDYGELLSYTINTEDFRI